MSFPLTERSFHAGPSSPNDATEAEYDRLRALARSAAQKRASCLQRSQEAYRAGDKALAHTLSQEGRSYGLEMERHNLAARDYIFRANNAGQPADVIDLHGLFVEEAEEVLGARINAATSTGEVGLHVVVGKGGHSEGGVRKIAPAVVRICEQRGLRWVEEENRGRIYVWLRPGAGEGAVPPVWGQQQQQQQQGGHQQQQQQQPDLMEQVASKLLPKIFKCCIIM